MTLLQEVRNQILLRGKTLGGCALIFNYLLDQGQNILQFMQLFTPNDVKGFYRKYQKEIDALIDEDEELLDISAVTEAGCVTLALEKCLILVEQESKVKV